MKSPDHKQRYRSYWVRGYDPDTQLYTLCDIAGNGEEIKVGIDRDGDKGDVTRELLNSLDRRERGNAPVRCVIRIAEDGKTGDTKKVINQVIPEGFTRDRESRKILDKNGEPISTWTPEMDKEVFRHSEFTAYESAMDHQKRLIEEPDYFNGIRVRAGEIMQRMVKEHEADLSILTPDEDMGRYIPDNCMAAFKGVELDDAGVVRQRRYDATASFEDQANVENSISGMAQLGNYAMQKAIVEGFAKGAMEGGLNHNREPISLAEAAQQELIDLETLLAGHPLKDSEDFNAETMETARIMGAAALAGVQSTCGAIPADAERDPIGTVDPVSGAPFVRFPIHGQIKRELDMHATPLDEEQRARAYLHVGAHRSSRYKHASKNKIFGIQKSVVPKDGKKPKAPPPLPPSIGMKDLSEAASAIGAAGASGAGKAMSDLANVQIPGL